MEKYVKPSLLHSKCTLSIFLLYLASLLGSCSGNSDSVIFEIGSRKVSETEFNSIAKKLNKKGEVFSTKESTRTFDNYISGIILAELGKEDSCFNNLDFVTALADYKTKLQIKYTQLKDVGSKQIFTSMIKDLSDANLSNYAVDYVFIPIKNEDISKHIFESIKSGGNISELYGSPKFNEWKKLDVHFFTGISTESSLLPIEVLKQIQGMKKDDVKVFKSKLGFYVVKILFNQMPETISKEARAFNLMQASAFEKGNKQNSYRLEESININDKLFLSIPFAVNPILSQDTTNHDNHLIAEFDGIKITETELKNAIYVLPLDAQVYFRNNSTRKKSIINFILASIQDNRNKVVVVDHFKRCLEEFLKNKSISDTLSFLKITIAKTLQTHPDKSVEDAFVCEPSGGSKLKQPNRISKLSFKKTTDSNWLFNDNLSGADELKLNFHAISKMVLKDNSAPDDREVLAKTVNWELTVASLKGELNKLTPQTRISIAKGDNIVRFVKYLAKKDNGAGNLNTLKTNDLMIKKVDVIGNSIDVLNTFEKNAIVGSLGTIKFTEAEIQYLVSTLPIAERNMFLGDVSSRKQAFKKLLVQMFWEKKAIAYQLDRNLDFQKDLESYRNWLLANTYYMSKIQIFIPEVEDEALNLKIKNVCNMFNVSRLEKALLSAASHFRLKINNDLLATLKIDPKQSMYRRYINK